MKKTKKSQRVTLYKKYKLDHQVKEELIENIDIVEKNEQKDLKKKNKLENRERKNKIREAKRRIRKEASEKKREVNINFKGKLIILVGSLTSENTGCTYLSDTLARYFTEHNRRVCTINLRRKSIERKKWCREFFTRDEMNESTENYEVIIYNTGNIENWNRQELDYQMASKKIIMCLDKEEYLMKLAEHVRKKEEEWFYVFNFIPIKKKKSIAALMEDYNHLCLPIYQIEDCIVDDIVEEIMEGDE